MGAAEWDVARRWASTSLCHRYANRTEGPTAPPSNTSKGDVARREASSSLKRINDLVLTNRTDEQTSLHLMPHSGQSVISLATSRAFWWAQHRYKMYYI